MTPTDNGLAERARRVLPGGITRTTVFVPPHPPYAASGRGAILTDETGHEVVDANNNYTSLIHGHAHPMILEAASDALIEGSAFGLPTRAEIELAEVLAQRTGLAQWRFCNSGTEAVMMLIRAARAYTGRDIVIRFEGSYHGTSDAVVDPTAPGIPRSTAESVVVVPQGDTAAVADLLRDHGADVAGVLIDLMPNRAGLVRAPSQHVEELRRLTAEHGTLLLVDEVITYRLGVGGLVAEYDIRPDLMSLGKVIGGGLPVGAIGGNAEVLAPFAPQTAGAVAWGGTFSANPVTMAAGLAVLRHLDRRTIARLNAQGDELRERLRAARVLVNGSGSLLQLISSDRTALWWALYERGVLLGTNGLLALSTPMTEAHVDAIRGAVMDVARTSPALLTAP